jgi:hypothetical protein
MVIKRCFLFLILPVLICSSGCGLFYTNVTRPYSWDFNNTPVGSKKATVSGHYVQVPVFLPFNYTRVSAEWDTADVNKAAREAGINRIYYADVHILSFLLNTYRRSTLIIYGD